MINLFHSFIFYPFLPSFSCTRRCLYRKGRKSSAVKALRMFSHASDDLQTIDLSEKVILAGQEAPHRGSYGGPEDPVIRERFNRSSVSQAVIGAFGSGGDNGLGEAAKISNKSNNHLPI
jgi:hypothetical protein